MLLMVITMHQIMVALSEAIAKSHYLLESSIKTAKDQRKKMVLFCASKLKETSLRFRNVHHGDGQYNNRKTDNRTTFIKTILF